MTQQPKTNLHSTNHYQPDSLSSEPSRFVGQSTNLNPSASLPHLEQPRGIVQDMRSSVRRRQLGLRAKTTLIGIALGVLPVIAIGGSATYVANQIITQKTLEDKERVATAISLRLNEFVRGRLNDVQTIASSPLITTSSVYEATKPEQMINYLDGFVEKDSTYAQIVAVTPEGGYAFLDNGKGLRTTKGVYSAEDDSYNVFAEKNIPYFLDVKSTLRPAISPLRVSTLTGKSSFFVAAPALTGNKLAYVIYSKTDAESISTLTNQFVSTLLKEQSADDSALQYRVVDHGTAYYEKTADGEKEITSARIQRNGNVVKIDGKEFKPGGNILLKENRIFVSNNDEGIGTEIQSVFPKYAALRQGGVAATVTDVSKLDGQEYLLTYVPIPKLENLDFDWGVLISQPTSVAFASQRSLILSLLAGTAITAIIVGAIAALLANQATRPLLAATSAVERIGQGELDTRVDVKGDDEIALLGVNINNMAGQIKTLLQEQAQLTEEQRRQKELLQERALELLEEVDPINEGDLTVRARVTEDDIGTIADAYNATVTNLREIVIKVQAAAGNVTETTRESELSVQSLSKEALYQAEKISAALEQVKQMAESVRLVAANAEKSAAIVQRANQTVKEGDAAMNRTVDGINAIRETVAETRQKVKYLGESSQRITAVVNLISSFAAQTKLVAFNALIEANRAGEAGRGFSVVAEEVRSLSQQSAEATTEIEKLVTTIQAETNEVMNAMEMGTEQVVIGTQLVEETRQSLNKITAASAEISELFSAISQATIEQSSTSDSVTQTMMEVAEISGRTSREADRVVAAFKELRVVAEELKQDADRFKVS